MAALLRFCTWLTQVGWPTPAVDVFVGLVGSWYSTWFSTLCQRGFPFHCFPLAGSAPSPFCCLPFAGAAPFQAPVCGLWLGWRGICCITWFSPMCRALPQGPAACAAFPAAGHLGGFQVTGCLPFCFPGDVGWASALPFFFCASPAPLACRGWLGYAPCVRVLQLRWCLLWVEGAFTLLPFPYLRVGGLLAYSVSGVCGLRRRSRLPFVVRPPFHVCVCPSPFSGVGVAWSQVCGPSCNSWVLDSSDARLRHPDALASGCTLSFCRRRVLPWVFIRTWVSRPRSCLSSYLLLVVLPFPCLGFRLATLAVGWSRHLLFSWALPWVLPSRFQCWLLA